MGMTPNAPARVPLWLAKRQWCENRQLSALDPLSRLYRDDVYQLAHVRTWNIFPTHRHHWRQPPGWQLAAARDWSGCGALPF